MAAMLAKISAAKAAEMAGANLWRKLKESGSSESVISASNESQSLAAAKLENLLAGGEMQWLAKAAQASRNGAGGEISASNQRWLA